MSERTGTVPFLAAAAAGVTVVLWASAFVGIRAAAEELTGGPLALARLLVALVGPVFVALLAGWLLHEGFPRTLLAGCAIAFSGALVIGASTSEDSYTPSLG